MEMTFLFLLCPETSRWANNYMSRQTDFSHLHIIQHVIWKSIWQIFYYWTSIKFPVGQRALKEEFTSEVITFWTDECTRTSMICKRIFWHWYHICITMTLCCDSSGGRQTSVGPWPHSSPFRFLEHCVYVLLDCLNGSWYQTLTQTRGTVRPGEVG